MSGIPLVRDEREQGAGIDRPHHSWSETGVLYDGAEPTHIARPVPEDEAREAVIAAAWAYRDAAPGDDRDARDRAYLRLGAALDRLDALDAT